MCVRACVCACLHETYHEPWWGPQRWAVREAAWGRSSCAWCCRRRGCGVCTVMTHTHVYSCPYTDNTCLNHSTIACLCVCVCVCVCVSLSQACLQQFACHSGCSQACAEVATWLPGRRWSPSPLCSLLGDNRHTRNINNNTLPHCLCG